MAWQSKQGVLFFCWILNKTFILIFKSGINETIFTVWCDNNGDVFNATSITLGKKRSACTQCSAIVKFFIFSQSHPVLTSFWLINRPLRFSISNFMPNFNEIYFSLVYPDVLMFCLINLESWTFSTKAHSVRVLTTFWITYCL